MNGFQSLALLILVILVALWLGNSANHPKL